MKQRPKKQALAAAALAVALSAPLLAHPASAALSRNHEYETLRQQMMCMPASAFSDPGLSVTVPIEPVAVPETNLPENYINAAGPQFSHDVSTAKYGYILVKGLETDAKQRCVVRSGTYSHTFALARGKIHVIPVTFAGDYSVMAAEQMPGRGAYTIRWKESFSVPGLDPLEPFLQSTEIVSWRGTKAAEKAASLCAGSKTDSEKIGAVYRYVIDALFYDQDKAGSVQSGYVPDLDAVMDSGRAICYDYAALMAGMLRSQDVPCKLVMGYIETKDQTQAYHAWVSAYDRASGRWVRYDPTSMSHTSNPAKMAQYVSDDANYAVSKEF